MLVIFRCPLTIFFQCQIPFLSVSVISASCLEAATGTSGGGEIKHYLFARNPYLLGAPVLNLC